MPIDFIISLESDEHEAASLRSASKTFATAAEPVAAVVDLTVSFEQRKLTVIAGPSGSGKSTTLAMVACLERPDRGEAMLGGRRVDHLSQRDRRRLRRRRIGVVQPQPSDNLLDSLAAFDNLRWAGRLRTGRDVPDDELEALLVQIGLHDVSAKSVRQLSGGEQQRLSLACALAGQPDLVVADEPTASLDRQSSAEVIAAMRSAADGGVTLVVASHDQHLIDVADLVVRLDHGRRVS